MDPIRLNLLPPEKQALLRSLVLEQFLRYLVDWCILVACLSVFVLLVLRIVAMVTFERAIGQIAESLPASQASATELITRRFAVRSLTELAPVVSLSHVSAEEELQALISLVPSAVALRSITVQRVEGSVQIVGIAGTRQDLLTFVDNINASKRFSTDPVPLTALEARLHIPFALTLRILPSAI